MKRNEWLNFPLPCSGIHAIFTNPQSARPLNKKDEAELLKLSLLEEKTDEDLARIQEIRDKKELFKDPPLSVTAKKYLIERYAWFKYEKKIASSGGFLAFIEKGNILEEQAINIMSEIDNTTYLKNEIKTSNGYIIGCPDIIDIEKGTILDVKVSWNINTFLKARAGLDDKYWFQAQGYMELFNVETVDICFLLLDTPKDIIEREHSKVLTNFMMGVIDRESYEEKMENLSGAMVYSNIPIKRRIIRYRVNKDKRVMPVIYQRVEKCREFLREYHKEHLKSKIILSLPPKKLNARNEDNTEHNTDLASPNDTGG
jgi:hypothetical protein